MQLSKRLAAVADMVTPGLVLADIGTDHAYIPIYLMEQQIIPRAIAADINRGPLARADAHIREHALEKKIETRLSDGLKAFAPNEAQSIVIAGMGGALTIRILENGRKDGVIQTGEHRVGDLGNALETPPRCASADIPPEGRGCHPARADRACNLRNAARLASTACLASTTELILQPQSEISLVRSWLEQNGWKIVREDMIFEDGKYYPMMKAKWYPLGSAMRETELLFGPRLLEMRHPVLRQFMLHERATQENVLKSLKQGKSETARMRELEVQRCIRQMDEALRLYGENGGMTDG
ncbi:MAG: class I SAM-dependent methyltransferase [Lachnospiraceae bacterium]|nr:class I SAM-dependent methyltransferase [Lachnospiraceae bacterium]